MSAVVLRLKTDLVVPHQGMYVVPLEVADPGWVSATAEAVANGIAALSMYHPGGTLLRVPIFIDGRSRMMGPQGQRISAGTVIGALYPNAPSLPDAG